MMRFLLALIVCLFCCGISFAGDAPESFTTAYTPATKVTLGKPGEAGQVYPTPPNVGLLANRPTFCSATGQEYYATDVSTLYYATVAGTSCTWAAVSTAGGGGNPPLVLSSPLTGGNCTPLSMQSEVCIGDPRGSVLVSNDGGALFPIPATLDDLADGSIYFRDTGIRGPLPIVENGDFEAGVAESESIIPPPGWTFSGPLTLSYDTTTQYEGVQSLKIVSTGTGTGFNVPLVPAASGDTFSLSGAIKGDGTATASICIDFLDKSQSSLQTNCITRSTASFSYLTTTGTAPANTVFVTIDIPVASSGTTEYDAVSVYKSIPLQASTSPIALSPGVGAIQGTDGNSQGGFQFGCNFANVNTATLYNLYCDTTVMDVLDGGYNFGGANGKSNYITHYDYLNGYAQGQHSASAASAFCYGNGDCIGRSSFAQGWGGANGNGDEGIEPLGDIGGAAGTTATVGTIASGGTTGSTSLVLSLSAGSELQGPGRYLIDTTQASSTGTVTTIAGTGPVTYTFTGVTLSASNHTTDSTAITAPGVATISVSSTTGITANSTVVCIADATNYETVIPTAVVANTSITANFRKPHATGAIVSNGGLCGSTIELTADQWTTTGAIGFWNVTNTLRQAWPIIYSTTSTAIVWISDASSYSAYAGQAATSTATDAYVIYPSAEVTSVQSAGAISGNVFTLAPNTVAWANTDAVELPLYPAEKMSISNLQMFKAFPSQSNQGGGFTMAYNGIWVTGDCLLCVTNNTPTTLYNAGGGGNLTAPHYMDVHGKFDYGVTFFTAPTNGALYMGCQLAGCSSGALQPFLTAQNVSGLDHLGYYSSVGYWVLTSGNGAHTFSFTDSGSLLLPSGSTAVGTTDTQTLTNKSIAGSEVNSGTVACAQRPALTGDVTASSGSCATTVALIGGVNPYKIETGSQTNTTVDDTTTDTALQTVVIPDALGNGEIVRISFFGYFSTTGAPTLTYRLFQGTVAGGNSLCGPMTITTPTGASQVGYWATFYIYPTAASGSSVAANIWGGGVGAAAPFTCTGDGSTISTQINQTYTLAVVWGATSVSDTITGVNIVPERLN